MVVHEGQAGLAGTGEFHGARQIPGLEARVAVQMPLPVGGEYKFEDQCRSPVRAGGRPPQREAEFFPTPIRANVPEKMAGGLAVDFFRQNRVEGHT